MLKVKSSKSRVQCFVIEDTVELERKKRKKRTQSEVKGGYDEFGEGDKDENFDVDDFLKNNDLLKRIQNLRLKTVKRKLQARKAKKVK